MENGRLRLCEVCNFYNSKTKTTHEESTLIGTKVKTTPTPKKTKQQDANDISFLDSYQDCPALDKNFFTILEAARDKIVKVKVIDY